MKEELLKVFLKKNIKNIKFESEKIKTFRGLESENLHTILFPKNKESLKKIFYFLNKNKLRAVVHGNRLSNGDQLFSANNIAISLKLLPKKLKIVKKNMIQCTSNITIEEINKKLEKKSKINNFNFPIIPGSTHITIGGAIANNVHDKKSFKYGNFYNFIEEMEIIFPNQKILKITKRKDIFNCVVGGLGLIGIILNVKIRLLKHPSYVISNIKRINNFNDFKNNLLNKTNSDFFVVWFDPASKNFNSIFENSCFSSHSTKSLNVSSLWRPIVLLSIKNFFLFFRLLPAKNKDTFIINLFNKLIYIFSFFYPSNKKISYFEYGSKVQNYFKIIGLNSLFNNGTFMLQITFSEKYIIHALKIFNKGFRKYGFTSPWSIIKKSKLDNGYLSFSENGFNLGFNFPNTYQTNKSFKKFLHSVIYNTVKKYKGKIYFCKDSTAKSEYIKNTYPKIKYFKRLKKKNDKNNILSHLLYERLFTKTKYGK